MTEIASRLWALPPDMIAEVIQRHSIEGLIPETLRAFTGQQAKAPADPIRDGATLIVPIEGVLSPKGGYGGTNTERLAEVLRQAGTDDKVGAVVLNVSSPGGLVYGTQEAADAIFELRQSKPVAAVASPMAASAAFWLATQAGAFYASPSADVGSVGVYAAHTDQSGFEDKIGMKTTLVSAGPKKVEGHPYAPLSDEARADMQEAVDESYRAFLAAISRGRGLPTSKVEEAYGGGALVSAQRAAAAGMVDGVMTVREVVAKLGSSRSRLALMRRRADAHLALHAI